ncbi:MAG: hypothetical protein M1484_00860 [Patescibacteria group bacterium]|nr:hypothetical protein [Patescibacteria group bacterium]MCL5431629.1 hypothetical protein [Patescibacteria group bacterium]
MKITIWEGVRILNKNYLIAGVAAVIVAAFALYGGYRVYNHFKKPVVVTPVQEQSTTEPAMTEPTMESSESAAVIMTGPVLTDAKGMTLYTYDKDTAGVSNCSGSCLANWPAFRQASPSAMMEANLSVIVATKQYTWKGLPLYYYIGDKKPGDMTGDGLGGVWHVVK